MKKTLILALLLPLFALSQPNALKKEKVMKKAFYEKQIIDNWEEYSKAFEYADYQKIASYFTYPLTFSLLDNPQIISNKKDVLSDLAVLTGATVINEDLGDDLDVINPDLLGTCYRSVTDDYETILQVDNETEEVKNLIDEVKSQIKEARAPGDVIRLEKRLSRLSAKVAIVKVGANSEIELKEKSDAEKPDILACSVRPNASLIGPQASV